MFEQVKDCSISARPLPVDVNSLMLFILSSLYLSMTLLSAPQCAGHEPLCGKCVNFSKFQKQINESDWQVIGHG